MAREKVLDESDEVVDREFFEQLRPRRFSEVIGQQKVVERLRVTLEAAVKRSEPLPHILLDGPPGLGKTTFATVLPNELGVEIQMTSGPALTTQKDLIPYLTNAAEKSVLFIDEIHRMPRVVEEFIYPAMEDFRIDFVIGEGIGARTINMPLKQFTVIGATTRSGMVSAPLRDRFLMHEHLEFYSEEELATIIQINARKLQTAISQQAALELAKRSRGTPRIANSRLRCARAYATSRCDGEVSLDVACQALNMWEIDEQGLDRQDRRYLETLRHVFEGGPAGIEAIAATMNVSPDTLVDEVEPYLLRRGFVKRTARGRQLTSDGYRHLSAERKGDDQPRLF